MFRGDANHAVGRLFFLIMAVTGGCDNDRRLPTVEVQPDTANAVHEDKYRTSDCMNGSEIGFQLLPLGRVQRRMIDAGLDANELQDMLIVERRRRHFLDNLNLLNGSPSPLRRHDFVSHLL